MFYPSRLLCIFAWSFEYCQYRHKIPLDRSGCIPTNVNCNVCAPCKNNSFCQRHIEFYLRLICLKLATALKLSYPEMQERLRRQCWLFQTCRFKLEFISKYSSLRTHTLERRTREEKTINNVKLLNLLAFNGIHFAVRRFRVTGHTLAVYFRMYTNSCRLVMDSYFREFCLSGQVAGKKVKQVEMNGECL